MVVTNVPRHCGGLRLVGDRGYDGPCDGDCSCRNNFVAGPAWTVFSQLLLE